VDDESGITTVDAGGSVFPPRRWGLEPPATANVEVGRMKAGSSGALHSSRLDGGQRPQRIPRSQTMKISLYKQALNLFVEVHEGKSNGVPTADCIVIARLIDPRCQFRYLVQHDQPFVEITFEEKDRDGKLIVDSIMLGMEE
jgi:hypothetical protein